MKLVTIIAAVVSILAVQSGEAQNLDLPFSSGSTGADGAFAFPTSADPSFGFAMAYDEARKEAVKFGGAGAAGNLAETWVLRSGGWQKLAPATSPPANGSPAMAYDPVREEIVMLAAGVTWTWNGVTWTQKAPTSSPSARSYATMCWDAARQEMVLYGGHNGSTALGDTWTWNGTDWTQKSPSTSPGARVGHAMAYYAPQSSVALATGNTTSFGNANTATSELWLWNGTNWSLVSAFVLSDGTNAGSLQGASLVYDSVRSELVLYGGHNFTGGAGPGYTFTVNSNLRTWHHTRGMIVKTGDPNGRFLHGAVWDSTKSRMLVTSGRASSASTSWMSDTWYWTGSDWMGVTGARYTFELDGKRDAVWNFTTINIPAGTIVNFNRNAMNSGVVWLASEGVTIAGTLDASGQNATTAGQDGTPAKGGPGGYDGGEGSSSSLAAQAGKGPAGGIAGIVGATVGGHAGLTSSYVTPFGIPLHGGSGGGGAHVAANNGSKGGGGGGALFIASSRDITISGTVKASGGTGRSTAPAGGHGGGGTIRLIGDRIMATGGTLNANGGAGSANAGLVRLEGFVRQYTPANVTGTLSQSVPVEGPLLPQAAGRLFIKTVDGKDIASNPTASLVNPDVLFTKTDEVTIVVEAVNIPNGTPVTLTIVHTTAGNIELAPVPVQNGLATFSSVVAAGTGTVQAFCSYTVGQAPPVP
jgi:hypothetical protein